MIRRKWGNARQFTPVALLRLAVGPFLARSINLGAPFSAFMRVPGLISHDFHWASNWLTLCVGDAGDLENTRTLNTEVQVATVCVCLQTFESADLGRCYVRIVICISSYEFYFGQIRLLRRTHVNIAVFCRFIKLN